LSLAKDFPLLTIEDEIAGIVEIYIPQKVMPADPSGDALHLAIASFHKCDFLVTWNCRYIANANKFGHLRRVSHHQPPSITSVQPTRTRRAFGRPKSELVLKVIRFLPACS
jgi:hypothetical protein